MNYIYPLGSGTIDNNIELRISLRSVERFDPECNIIVVGDRPAWANDNLHHIPCPDLSKYNKDGNMINKVLLACKDVDDFVRMSDDHVIMNKPYFTPYYDGHLTDHSIGNPNDRKWNKRAWATNKYLIANSYPNYCYDLHCPVKINAQDYLKTMNKLDKYYLFYDRGYLINSIYFNMTDIERKEVPACHVIRLLTDKFDVEYVDRFTFLNYKNASFTVRLREHLLGTFNQPSKFEIA